MTPTPNPPLQGDPIERAGASRVSSRLFGRQILFRLRIIRKDFGFSQKVLSKISMVSTRTISTAETGTFISFESAEKIARGFGLPLKMFWESYEGEKKWKVPTNCKGPQPLRIVPNLRERRKKAGWASQDQFAGMAEIGLRVLGRAERGKPVKEEIANKIEEALK